MTYYEFMYKPQNLKRQILRVADDVAFKMEICTKTTTTLGERVQTSQSNSTEKSYVAYIDAKRKLDALVEKYNAACSEVEQWLYSNLDYKDADLLAWRYIHDKTAQETAEIIGLATQTVKNGLSRAERHAKQKFNSVQKSTEKY